MATLRLITLTSYFSLAVHWKMVSTGEHISSLNVYWKFTEIYVVSAADDWKQAEAKKPH